MGWNRSDSLVEVNKIDLQMGYPLYEPRESGSTIIALLRGGSSEDLLNAELITESPNLLLTIQCLLIDLQTLAAKYANSNLYSCEDIYEAENAIEIIKKYRPGWENPAAYAIQEEEEEDDEDEEDVNEDDEDDEDEDLEEDE